MFVRGVRGRVRGVVGGFAAVVLLGASLAAVSLPFSGAASGQTYGIVFEAPSGLQVAVNRDLAVDASDYVTPTVDGDAISCAAATDVDATRLTVTRSNCVFTVSPLAEGVVSFTVPYSSAGGASHDGEISIDVGPPDEITITTDNGLLPSDLQVGANQTLVINALEYVRDAYHAITCGQASIVTLSTPRLASVPNDGCRYTVTPVNSLTQAQLGRASFRVSFTSAGLRNYTMNAEFWVDVGPASAITVTPPLASGAGSLATPRNRTLVIDADRYASDGTWTISCGEPSGIHSDIFSVVRNGCDFTVTPQQTATTGAATFSVPFTSAGGTSADGQFTVNIEADTKISYTPPPETGAGSLIVPQGSSRTIDVSGYASETDSSSYTITCGQASAFTSRIISVSNSPGSCNYTVTAAADASITTPVTGQSFTVPYISTGGATTNAVVPISIGPASSITLSIPEDLQVATGGTITVYAAGFATDGPYGISCGNASSVSASLQSVVSQTSEDSSGCTYLVTAGSGAGSGAFTVLYTSNGGSIRSGQIPVNVVSAASISWTPPASALAVAGRTVTIDASSASHASLTVTCDGARNISSRLASVTRTGGCVYQATAASSPGTGFFTIPFTVRDADNNIQASRSVQVAITISAIAYTAPAELSMNACCDLEIDASQYATDGSYTISCQDPEDIHPNLSQVTRGTGANACVYTATAAETASGTATFTVPYRSTGGHTLNATITIAITPRSNIITGQNILFRVHNSNYHFFMSFGETYRHYSYTINLRDFFALSDGDYTIMCGSVGNAAPNPSGLYPAMYVVRNGCDYTFTTPAYRSSPPSRWLGHLNFNMPVTSSGGHTTTKHLATRVEASHCRHDGGGPCFNRPAPLSVAAGASIDINTHGYAGTEAADIGRNPFTYSCSDIAYADPNISATRLAGGNGCDFRIAAVGHIGPASFDFSYISTTGGVRAATIPIQITVAADSNIVFSPPPASDEGSIIVPPSHSVVIDISRYATDTGYVVSCSDISNIDPKLTSVRHISGCSYRVITGGTLGSAGFDVSYISTGGDIHTGTIPINIAPRLSPQGTQDPLRPPDPGADPEDDQPDDSDRPDDPGQSEEPGQAAAEPDRPGPRWNTLTARQGGTTARQVRQAFGISADLPVYTWNPDTRTWTQPPEPTTPIPQGAVITFRTPQPITRQGTRAANLGNGPQQTRLTSGWNILNLPTQTTITAENNAAFLIDPALTDCDNQQGVLAIASYSTRTRQWAISTPCHPATQTRLTTGNNPPYQPLTAISPADTIYIYTQTTQPLNIIWNPQTRTYQHSLLIP